MSQDKSTDSNRQSKNEDASQKTTPAAKPAGTSSTQAQSSSAQTSSSKAAGGADNKPAASPAKTDQGKTDQSKTDQSKTDQSKTDQSKTDQSKTDQSKTDQSKPDQSKAGAGKKQPEKPASSPQSSGNGSVRSGSEHSGSASRKTSSASGTQTSPAASDSATSGAGAKPASKPASSDAATGGHGGRGGQRGGQGSGGGRGNSRIALIVAAVALVVAVLAIAGAGYLWYASQQRMAALNAEIGSATDNVQHNLQQQLGPRVSQMNDQVDQLTQKLGRVDNTLDDRGQKLSSLSDTLNQVQTQNNKLQQALGGNHEQFVEQRILALLEAANQRLVIYHDPKGAMQALKLADQAIAHAGYPQLHPVRADIANEVASLEALPDPDIEGIALQLSQLAARVPKLPTDSDVPSTYHNGNTGQAGDRAGDDGSRGQAGFAGIDWQGHWHRMVDRLGNALSHMVTVRSANGTQNAPALIAPDQSFFLVQNLQLELRMARLALLEHNGEVYHESLSEARDWIGQYFDTDDSATQAVLSSLKTLSDVQLDWQAPDITPSLTHMRRIANAAGASDQSTSAADVENAASDSGEGQAPDDAQGGDQRGDAGNEGADNTGTTENGASDNANDSQGGDAPDKSDSASDQNDDTSADDTASPDASTTADGQEDR
ncbi:uroporphyrinogen-III C-methyltransferase [Salinisphaera sp. Q1T1-3]|uniref:uroporphyrinogen-III C-methyltransferase n=1 Tax=Salinisphaera sp. Q1T1-3 TaxID=2321229 RepID=UPI000E7395A7|nr:uroporphyrinogen-III C-methyltransferase [Salinisphaera sp. Q1T1-3]RJS91391.1 hypothetical protein D3260_15410 [Salinisphaera sp. Q1T1-3]